MATPPPDQVLFRCHACRQKFAVKPSRIGAKFKCTKCEAVLQVPAENALDRPEASKPQVKVQAAKVNSSADSINELSFDDLPALSAGASAAVAAPVIAPPVVKPKPASPKPAVPEAEKPAPVLESTPDSEAGSDAASPPKTPDAPAGGVAPPSFVPKGKKACPNCAHICPGMAMSCPLCQHRFEAPKPQPKPAAQLVAASSAEAEAVKPDTKAATKVGSKAGSPALKPKRDLGKALDNAVTLRGKGVGRPVEPPMWMDEAIYGTAFKMGFAGLACLGAALVVFIQLDSPESARNAFILIRWLYPLGGRWVPSILCLACGLALLYFAIKPVVDHIKRERESQKTVPPLDE